MIRTRLYLQIYLIIIATLIAVVFVSITAWNIFGRDRLNRDVFDMTERIVFAALPPASSPGSAQREALLRFVDDSNIRLTLFAANRNLIAATGRPSKPPRPRRHRSGWHREGHGPGWVLHLPDGRWLVADIRRSRHGGPLLTLVISLSAIALVIGLVAYPFVRRLTRRVEALQKGVERIGAGELSARVAVNGRDEIAALAGSFNQAAEKIEALVNSHRALLANASHELRTPLSRIRMGVELLSGRGNDKRRTALKQDIAELDGLIGEILLMSRLDSGNAVPDMEVVDLHLLAQEECARYENCALDASPVEVLGNKALLTRLIRNLIDNAFKHGKPPVTVSLRAASGFAVLVVADQGDGIPAQAREKIFQRFYRAPDRQNVDGFGLGLPLVRQIAEAHGGSAQVIDGGGFSIEVRLATCGSSDQAGHMTQ